MALTKITYNAITAQLANAILGASQGRRAFRLLDVDTDEIWQRYIQSIPAGQRQEHNCRTCKSHLTDYFSMVFVDTLGNNGIVPSISYGAVPAEGTYARAISMAQAEGIATAKGLESQAQRYPNAILVSIGKSLRPIYSRTGYLAADDNSSIAGGYTHFCRPQLKVNSGDMASTWEATCRRMANLVTVHDAHLLVNLTNQLAGVPHKVRSSFERVLAVLTKIVRGLEGKNPWMVAEAIARNYGSIAHNSLALEYVAKAKAEGFISALNFVNAKTQPEVFMRKTAPMTTGQLGVLMNSPRLEAFTKLTNRKATIMGVGSLLHMPQGAQNAVSLHSQFAGGTVKTKQRVKVESLTMTPREFVDTIIMGSNREKILSMSIRPLTTERSMQTGSAGDTAGLTPLFNWGSNYGFYMVNRGRTDEGPKQITRVVASPALYKDGSVYKSLVFANWESSEPLLHSGVFEEVLNPEYKEFGRAVEALSRDSGKLQQVQGMHHCFGIALNSNGQKFTAAVSYSDGRLLNINVS